MKIDYSTKYAPTLALFHRCSHFVRGIRGPIGSGKSVACCMEIIMRALQQEPGPDGIKRSRWAVVRGTYPELISTTMKTWLQWVRDDIFGSPSYSAPITHKIKLDDDCELEVVFLALDKDKDVKKLLSLELTGAWINEAKEVPKSVLEMLTGRVGRFPAQWQGGPTWSGVIMDTNSPDDDHWWYKLAEEIRPEGYKFFAQPSGLSGEGENLPNLPGGIQYYKRQIPGKDPDWINVYIHGLYGSVEEGKPVYHEWNRSKFVSVERLQPYRSTPLIVGMDFGLTPAAVVGQITPRGQLRVLAEVVAQDMGIKRFISDALKPVLATEFPGLSYFVVGDPAGAQRAQTDERTCFDELLAQGVQSYPAPTNNFATRREAVANYMTKIVDGDYGLQVDNRCVWLIKGFNGRYRYRRMQIAGSDRYTETPDKNEYSHPHDALQYMALGTTFGSPTDIVVGDVGLRIL